MRNETITLTAAQHSTAYGWANFFADMLGSHVNVAFTKRDGTPRVISGPVSALHIVTTPDHMTVTVDTDKGPRSANLYAIDTVTTTGE